MDDNVSWCICCFFLCITVHLSIEYSFKEWTVGEPDVTAVGSEVTTTPQAIGASPFTSCRLLKEVC